MAKFLQQLLRAEEPMFSHSLKDLEKATGHKGVDVRLIADITAQLHAAIHELGLEPQYVNGKELYLALLARIRRDNERLAAKLGGRDANDTDHMTPLLLAAVRGISENQRCWALKPHRARDLLKNMPPQRLLELFEASSVEQLLDTVPLEEVYVALRFSEGAAWLRRFNEQFEELVADDFEVKDIAFISLEDKYTPLVKGYISKRHHAVSHSKEFGVVALLPQPDFVEAATVINLAFLLHYRNEVRMYSSFFQFRQASNDFGRIVAHTLNHDVQAASQMAKRRLHWRVVQRYFGAIDDRRHPEVLQPHIHPEDLHWRKVEEQLVKIDPAMKFWQGREYVGKLYDDEVVTVNLLDIATAYAKNLPYEQREAYHFRESLWNEILIRYMGEENLQRQVLVHLGADSINVTALRG